MTLGARKKNKKILEGTPSAGALYPTERPLFYLVTYDTKL
mgnify:CR=1 FL=1